MKVSHFPDFFPDETVFSVAARYLDRMGFSSHSVVNYNFFGGPERSSVTDLPSSLEHLVQSLPPNHTYTTNIIINRHTLFPYYAPFLPNDRAFRLSNYMRNNNPSLAYTTAGIAGGKALRPNWLKYCPTCVDYDRSIYGEGYWHRIHQVPGVLVCPMHEIMLENSSVSLLREITVPKFHSVESTVVNSTQRVAPSHFHPFLVRLAQNVQWLLECWTPREQWSLRQEYVLCLTNRGFVTATGLVRNAKLKAAILDYYPADLLEIIGCATTKANESWFEAWTKMHHPLHHLLFIQFLCETTEDFFTKFQTPSYPFGKGPWPCLNPLCSHYQDRVITSYTIRQGELNQPSGIFSCRCGYIYTRIGPDKDDNAIFHGRVSQYGEIWNQYLTTFWLDQNVSSVRQIALLMHADARSICRQAARLNLPFAPDISNRGKRPAVAQYHINEKRVDYRILWEKALKSNSSGTVLEIINSVHKAYSWLKRHDPDWLKEHYPNLALPSNNDRLINGRAQRKQDYYSQIDANLAEITKRIAEKIYIKSGFPTQVTRRMLVAQIGDASLAKRSDIAFDNLPLTSQAFKDAVETDIVFIWRKLRWTVQSFLIEQTYPSYYKFLKRAQTYSGTSERPAYKSLIEFAYNELGIGKLLDEQIPEDLVKQITPILSGNESIREANPRSLALALLKTESMLFKTLRRQKRGAYVSISILLLVSAAIVNGAESYGAIAHWGYQNEELLITFGFSEGSFPLPITIKNQCNKINLDSFEQTLEAWLCDNFPNIIVDTIKINTGNTYIPGLRQLQAYQCIASDVMARLY